MSEHDDAPQAQEAFERLRHQASSLDTMAARRAVTDRASRPAWLWPTVAGAAAVLLLVVGMFAFTGDDDSGEQVATDNPTPDTSDNGETPPAGTAEALDATTWTLVEGSGPTGDVAILDGWPLTLSFDGGTIGGTAACNGYGGTFALDGDELRIDELSQTEMACGGPEVMDAEAAFLTALLDVDVLVVDGGQLILTGPSSVLVFELDAPVPTTELVGQLWLLDTLIEGETASTVRGEPATLLLREGGTIEGGTGCRTLQGEYVISGASVIFTTFGAEGDCPSELSDQDNVVVTVLGDGFTVNIDGDRLTLTSQGNEGLSYRAITEDELEGLASDPVTGDAELPEGVAWIFGGGQGPDGPIDDPRTVDVRGLGDEVFFEGGEPIVSLEFAGDLVSGFAICNQYGSELVVDGSSMSIAGIESTQEGCGDPFDELVEQYYTALTDVSAFAIDASTEQLILVGGDTELIFERADLATTAEAVSVAELLDDPPIGTVPVEGRLLYRGGNWILCDSLGSVEPPFCVGRWLTLTNYDAVLNLRSEPATSRDDVALELAALDDDVAADDGVVWSVRPATVTLALLEDGRAADPAQPSGVEPADEELELAAAYRLLTDAGPSIDTSGLRLSPDGVRLGLTDNLLVTRSPVELTDTGNWAVAQDAWRGRAGSFSAPELLRAGDETELVVGPHDHCASPPAPIHPDLRDLRHLSLQPTGIDSCLAWFTIDLYLDDAGNVAAITLDLWEP